MPPIDPKWFNVNEDAQIWAGHSDAHKQFILEAPAGLMAVEEYKGSYRFEVAVVLDEEGSQVPLELPLDAGYPEAWIRAEDVTTDPYEGPVDDGPLPEPGPDPVPGKYSDAEIGAAFRLLADVLMGR
jgi:hypothetical protein